MYGGYEGGWNPATYLTGENADFPLTRYQNKSGHDYLDFKDWALGKWNSPDERDTMLKNIYFSAKAMKFTHRSQRLEEDIRIGCQCSHESYVT